MLALSFCQLCDHFLPEQGEVEWDLTHELPLLVEEKVYHVTNTMNYSDGDYGRLCISYALNVMACNQLAWSASGVGDNKDANFWSKLQYQVRNKYLRRKDKDAGQLLSFID